MIDQDTFVARVQERVNASSKSEYDLAIDGGFSRNYIYDILNGRKAKVHSSKITKLADALDCDPEYLRSQQDSPRRSPGSRGIFWAGVCETGVWRSSASRASIEPVGPPPVDPDPRFPGLKNLVFLAMGDGMAGAGIAPGSIISAIDAAAWVEAHGDPAPNSVVVAEASRPGFEETEISLRMLVKKGKATVLEARPGNPAIKYEDLQLGDNVRLLGIVTRAVRSFVDFPGQ